MCANAFTIKPFLRNVSCGSKADLTPPKSDFRYTPESGLKTDIAPCPKSARNGLMHREACRRYLVVRFVDQGIGVEPLVGHYAIDEVVYDGRDAVDTAEPLVKVGRILRGHWHLLLPHSAKVDSMARFCLSLASLYGDPKERLHPRALSLSLFDRATSKKWPATDLYAYMVRVRLGSIAPL